MSDNAADNSTVPPADNAVPELRLIIEAALFTANRPLNMDNLLALFPEADQSLRRDIREVLKAIRADCENRSVELVQVASGWRLQVRPDLTPYLRRLWHRRPPRYSRALLETLALIAYRQPITRSEIEAIRGVSVSTSIIRTLQDFQWIRVLAYRESPGRPALYGTTRAFLDYFGLKSLDQLPTLAELKEMQDLQVDILDFMDESEENDAVDQSLDDNDLTDLPSDSPGTY